MTGTMLSVFARLPSGTRTAIVMMEIYILSAQEIRDRDAKILDKGWMNRDSIAEREAAEKRQAEHPAPERPLRIPKTRSPITEVTIRTSKTSGARFSFRMLPR